MRGQRDHYQPVRSRLCAGNEPCIIVQAMLGLYPFTTSYIADLDAIQGNGKNEDVINTLQQEFPQLVFWLDKGLSSQEELSVPDHSSIKHVIGTETGITLDTLNEIVGTLPESVLSLDFRAGTFWGDAQLLKHPEIWPENIIVMDLARVGSSEGPDMELLHNIKSVSSGKNIYVAGGIRDMNDLQKLDENGVAGALVATALHNGTITGADISSLE